MPEPAHRMVCVMPSKAEAAGAWARKVGVSHRLMADGTLRLYYVTPRLREMLRAAVGPTSVAEDQYAAAAAKGDGP